MSVPLSKRLAELIQHLFASLHCSEFGQKESFEHTGTRRKSCSEVRIVASIEDPDVIQKILAHLDDNTPCVAAALQPECRAPPLAELLESF